VRRGLEYNVLRTGAVYADLTLATADPNPCAQACATDARCHSFTCSPPPVRGATADCRLMSGTPGPSAFSGAVSGVKRGLKQDSDRWGGDYKRLSLAVVAPEACQAECAKDSPCKAFTFVPAGWYGTKDAAQCLLKSSVGPAVAGSGLVSGVRGAEFF
jgi:hypothetical protein